MLSESEKNGTRDLLNGMRNCEVDNLAKTISQNMGGLETRQGKCNALFK
jgi:hypothetical protein